MPRHTHQPGDREQQQNDQEQRERQVRELEAELHAAWQARPENDEGVMPDSAEDEPESDEQS